MVPLAATAAVAALRGALSPVLANDSPLLVFLLAVIVSAHLSGLGGGLVATALCLLTGNFPLISPRYELWVGDDQELFRMALFAIEGVIVSLLFDRVRISETRARRASKRVENVLTVVSHELRNPLAAMATATATLVRQGANSKAAAVLERQIRHVQRLVADLGDLPRLQSERFTLLRQEVPLDPILKAAGAMAAPEFEQQQQVYQLRTDHDDCVVDVDPVRVQQVLGNLLINASRYSPPGARIRMHSRLRDDDWVIAVTDTGKGIVAKDVDRVFEPFARGVQDDRGFGVGLAVVRSLVEMHSGAVRVQSEGAGKGSTFTIEFPDVRRPRTVLPRGVVRQKSSREARLHGFV
jgi:two-component system CheB/CheR fusion protein